MERSAGILLAISSLPSKYGIGSFSKEAYRFVDWLRSAHQSYWGSKRIERKVINTMLRMQL